MSTPNSIRDSHAAKQDEIRARTELTPQARQVLHARTYTAAKAKMADLAESDADAARANATSLARSAFGHADLARFASPGDLASLAISSRDAQDRAAQLTSPQEALALLNRAETSGDELLARAIGARAHELGGTAWDGVLQQFIQDRPKQAEAVNALRELPQTNSLQKFFDYVVPKPTELGNRDDSSIAQIANDPSVIQ